MNIISQKYLLFNRNIKIKKYLINYNNNFSLFQILIQNIIFNNFNGN